MYINQPQKYKYVTLVLRDGCSSIFNSDKAKLNFCEKDTVLYRSKLSLSFYCIVEPKPKSRGNEHDRDTINSSTITEQNILRINRF